MNAPFKTLVNLLVSSNNELFSSAAFRQVLKQSSNRVYSLIHKTLYEML